MHELSLARRIVETLRRHLPPGGGRAVKSVTLRLGEFSRIAPESLELWFEMAAEGTPAQGAKLRIETVPVRGRCVECGADFEGGRFMAHGPNCGRPGVELISGIEPYGIEVELFESER
ncbi:MAG TPA: hydrogenase maturation nickel metallochaperone HypA [Nitrospiria bacterium]|jgi:hydrogenase nickel incorporation protein HypA/HybF|nr:hydrogenase maturation nickel metallochaperone HypA [Nitrospiria bacterium]